MKQLDIGSYKHKLIQDIIHCDKIVRAIDSKLEGYDSDCPDSLINLNVFPFIHIPKIQASTETYIMLACDATNISSFNSNFHNIKLTIRVMSHQDNLYMKGENNTRIDYISNELIALLEDSKNYGLGRLQLISNREIVLNERYIYRELTFKTIDMR